MAGMASLLILLILLATAIAAQAQTFQVLHTFTGGDGVGPDAGLTMDRSGRLYGTVNGGTGNFGSVFRNGGVRLRLGAQSAAPVCPPARQWGRAGC